MANRFQELFRLLPKLYSTGAPVMIEAGTLQKDSATNRVLAQLRSAPDMRLQGFCPRV